MVLVGFEFVSGGCVSWAMLWCLFIHVVGKKFLGTCVSGGMSIWGSASLAVTSAYGSYKLDLSSMCVDVCGTGLPLLARPSVYLIDMHDRSSSALMVGHRAESGSCQVVASLLGRPESVEVGIGSLLSHVLCTCRCLRMLVQLLCQFSLV